MTHEPAKPVFVVVGHVNRGKSSIVSTLAADDSVRIGPEPGTTRHNRSFPMRLRGRTLYTLVDTPGFERARHVRDWLHGHTDQTADRAAAVCRFVTEHEQTPDYPQECELLRPIMEGGAILYVVDGSSPFSPQYEAEMEILRWTSRPRMALINTTGPDDHTATWRRVLDQYFSLVRTFNAHHAGFSQRIELLSALRELNEIWRTDLDHAIEALRADRASRQRDAAQTIAAMLVSMLTHTEEKELASHEVDLPHRQALRDRYYQSLREMEHRCRDELRQIYDHHELQVHEAGLAALQDDLFDTSTWSRLGLTRTQLAAAGAFTGALAGGLIDAAVGGASVMIGSLIGVAVGAGSSYYGWKRLEDVEILGQPMAGRLLSVGPMRNAGFPWVALDRAMIYHNLLAHRAHARRGHVDLGDYRESSGLVRGLDGPTRSCLEALFNKLRKGKSDPQTLTGQLSDKLATILADSDNLPGNTS